MLDSITDFIVERCAERQKFTEWHSEFKWHCRHDFYRDFVRIAYTDRKNGFKASHPGAERTVRNYWVFQILMLAAILFGLILKNLFLPLCGLVVFFFWLPTRKAYFDIVKELSEIATRAARIYSKDGGEHYENAEHAIRSGEIVTELLHEREEMAKKKAKEHKAELERQLKEFMEEDSDGPDAPASPPAPNPPPTPARPVRVVTPVPLPRRK